LRGANPSTIGKLSNHPDKVNFFQKSTFGDAVLNLIHFIIKEQGMPSGKKRKRRKIATHKRKKKRRANRHKKK